MKLVYKRQTVNHLILLLCVLVKLFKSANIDVISEWYFDFPIPSEILAEKCAKLEKKSADHKTCIVTLVSVQSNFA